jgi:uroporphyrinogen decarboxylase
MAELTSRERVLAAIAHKEADRVAVHDSPWGTTEARWHREGLPEGQSSADYFGFEFRGSWADNSLQLETRVIEETDEYIVSTTGDGNTWRNWKGRSSTPELLDFLVTSRTIWDEHKPRMAFNEGRVDWEGNQAAYDDARARGLFFTLSFGPGFTKVCDMVGPERLLIAMVEEPEWVSDMLLTDARLCAEIAEEMLARGLDADAGWIFDDLGYKHKSFFSPAVYREMVQPAHRIVAEPFKRRGKPMLLHTCGFAMELMPALLETGFDVIQPLEVKAGNDLLALKRDYGDRACFMGGIDVRTMAHADPAVIEREIAEKIPVAMRGGGYIYHSDHSVPDDVSFQQYQRVMELVAHYGRY